jgi:hypothetical protein
VPIERPCDLLDVTAAEADQLPGRGEVDRVTALRVDLLGAGASAGRRDQTLPDCVVVIIWRLRVAAGPGCALDFSVHGRRDLLRHWSVPPLRVLQQLIEPPQVVLVQDGLGHGKTERHGPGVPRLFAVEGFPPGG